MKLDWMILANAAEIHGGLLTMMGGGWDTVTPGGETPPGTPAAYVRGSLVARILMNRSETERPHVFEIRVMDGDGENIAPALEGEFTATLSPDLPTGWDQSFLIAIDMTGMPLPVVGMYEMTFSVDGHFLGSRPFRVRFLAE